MTRPRTATRLRRDNFQPPHPLRRNSPNSRRLSFETLEDRRMLSTFVWTNRGQASDNFQSVFGANASAARAVVDAALTYWQRIITFFNYSDGSNTYSLNISMLASGTGFGANASTTALIGGKPSAANLTIARGNDTSVPADGIGDGAGWFLDPTPFEHSEFLASLVNPFAATSGGGTFDLLTPVLHEIGHAVGIFAGGRLNNIATDTTIDDPNGGATGANLWRVDGNNVTALMTGYDSGGAATGPSDKNGPQHYANAGTQWPAVNPTHFGAVDLMNSGYSNGDRRIPSLNDALMLADAYGYNITTPDAFGTMHAFVTGAGQLLVRGMDGASNDTITITRLASGLMRVSVDVGADVPGIGITGPIITDFNPATFTSIKLQGLGGNDTIRMSYSFNLPVTIEGGAGDDTIELGYSLQDLDFFGAPITINGGGGANDRVFLYDNADSFGDTYTITGSQLTKTGNFGPLTYSSIDGLYPITGTGDDVINILSTASGTGIVVNSAGGADTVNIGNAANGVQSILGDVQVQNDPSFTLINIDDGPNANARNFAIDQWDGNLGAIGGLAPAYITWDRSDVQTLNITTGTNADQISLLRTSEAINFYHANLFNARDNLIIGNDVDGMQSITGAIRVSHTAGLAFTDVTLKDTADAVGRSAVWTHNASGSIFTIAGMAPAAISYDYQAVVFLNVLGGSGNDAYEFVGIADDWAQTYIDGGLGFNTLEVDDVANPYSATVADIYPGSIHRGIGTAVGALDIYFSHINSPTYLAKNSTTSINVYGVSSEIPSTHQLTVISGAGDDTLTLYPHDPSGNLTVNGNFGYGGGGGADTLLIDDTYYAAPTPINYTFYNQFGPGTTNIGGMGAAGFGAGSDVENIYVYGGANADTFSINSFKSGSGLKIDAGGGDDVVNFGAANLTADITNMAYFQYDGQGGSDTLNINNTANPNGFTYGQGASGVTMSNGMGANYIIAQALAETLRFNAGAAVDLFYIDLVPSGTQTIINAGASLDGLLLGQVGNLESIQGQVVYSAEADGGNMAVIDTGDTSGDTVHQDQNSLGAYPDDNLFGPGGSLQFSNLVNFGVYPGITLNLGSGADTIYAQPLPTARVTINAGNPTTAPGDKLTLALAQAQSPVVTGTSTGNVTSANLQTLDWTGIETLVAPDTIAPTVDIVDVTPDPRTTGVTSIAINFTEAVAGFNLADLSLTRDGGANLLPASATLTSGNQINWTLGNLSGLTNVSGTYVLTLTAAGSGIADLAGNPLAVSASDTWIANIPELMGDANGDGVVNIFDINLVSAHWGEMGPLGDANHDNMVNIFDINLVSANWGMGGGGAGGDGGAGAGLADLDQSPPAVASTPLRIANAAAEPTTVDQAAGPKSVSAAAAGAVLPSLGNLNAMLANWGAATAAPSANERATNPSALELAPKSNDRRPDSTLTVAPQSAPSRGPVVLHPASVPPGAAVVDAAFRQGHLIDWGNHLLDDLFQRDQEV
jgi:Planctomycete extracellular